MADQEMSLFPLEDVVVQQQQPSDDVVLEDILSEIREQEQSEKLEDEQIIAADLEEQSAENGEAEDVFYQPVQENQIGLFGEQLEPWRDEWRNMPEYVSQEMKPYAIVIMRFGSKQALDDFSKLIDQPLQRTTKSAWYPKPVPRGTHLDSSRRYVDEA